MIRIDKNDVEVKGAIIDLMAEVMTAVHVVSTAIWESAMEENITRDTVVQHLGKWVETIIDMAWEPTIK